MNDIEYDRNNHVYLVGGYQGTMDFDPNSDAGTMTSSMYSSAFVAKYDTAGNYKWSFDYDYSTAYACDIDKHGDFYFGGYYFLQSIDADPSPNTYMMPLTGFWESYICKFTPDSALIWATHFTTTNLNMNQRHSAIHGIDVGEDGSIYSAGEFNAPVDVDPGPGTTIINNVNASDDAFVHKFTQCFLWDSVSLQNQTLTSMENAATYQWYNCDQQKIIPGATSVSYTAITTGYYSVILNTAHCSDTSDCIYVEVPVSVRNVALAKQVKVFPNPSSGDFQLEVPAILVGKEYKIEDVLGRTVAKGHLSAQQNSVQLKVAAGGYFLKIVDQEQVILVKKLIIQ